MRSGEASATQKSYLESLIELLICRLNHIIVCEDCKASDTNSMRALVSTQKRSVHDIAGVDKFSGTLSNRDLVWTKLVGELLGFCS